MHPGPGAPSVVVGTAGHVDHGKTALVHALTGINTDRLAEEQQRELSIDIGFAHLDLPDGTRLGIVDVPGHERFVKNMLAGATGIDLVMLVVAADEGVMPQTVEHLDIVSLLGIETGLVVITKTDLVDEELAALAEEDIREALRDSPLARAPVVRTSARTGQGLPELVDRLMEAAAQVRRRDVRGPARLPIDRVFSVAGFGLVVTGTLVRGRLAVGDEVEILPQGFSARVRGLQTHGVDADEVRAARRAAVNLMRVSGEGVERGATLCAPGSMKPSGLLDVRLQLLQRAPWPVKQRTRIRLHHGTAELLGRAYLLDRDLLAPGDSCLAQLRLEGLVAASRGDRCVIRSYSPMLTIGGAVVLDPTPARHRRQDNEVLARLETLAAGDPLEVAREWVARRGAAPFTTRDLAAALQTEVEEAERLAVTLVERGDLRGLGSEGPFVSAEAHDALQASATAAIRDFHAAHPLQAAMPKDALQAVLQRPHPGLLTDVLDQLVAVGRIDVGPGGVRARGFEVRLSDRQERAVEAMVRLARQGGFAPPTREALLAVSRCPEPEARALLARLTETGELVPVGEHVYHREALEEVQRRLRQHFRTKGPFTVAELRDLTGSSRKYCVPLAEHLDGIGFTRRQGDLRVVIRPDAD